MNALRKWARELTWYDWLVVIFSILLCAFVWAVIAQAIIAYNAPLVPAPPI